MGEYRAFPYWPENQSLNVVTHQYDIYIMLIFVRSSIGGNGSVTIVLSMPSYLEIKSQIGTD